MKRAQRLEMVQRVVEEHERRRAEALASSERRLSEGETKLRELQHYQNGYTRDFAVRAESGMDGAMARDYQVFLARLDEALRQQSQVLTRARAQRDSELQSWQSAAQRAEAIGQMLRRFQSEEQRALERREQYEADERSQRSWCDAMVLRGV